MKTYKVEVSNMNGSDTRIQEFPTYKKALQYYTQKCDDLNIDDGHRQWPAVEANLEAGGRGYDYRVSLLVEEENKL